MTIGTVVRREIPDYFTREFAEMLDAWAWVKRWGMPFEGGWADQPAQLMDVIGEFEKLYNEWESEEARR